MDQANYRTDAPNKMSITAKWTVEATLPKPREIAALSSTLVPRQEIYLSTLPHVSLDQQVETAKIIKQKGFEPVPHIAARYFANQAEIEEYLSRISRETAITKLLVIGGDLDQPQGDFSSALDLINTGLLPEYGIRRIGVAAYPDMHPKISRSVLDQVLDKKIASAMDQNMAIQVVTQFCFHAEPILAWLETFRNRHKSVEIKLGFAGPTSFKSVMHYALRCGVKVPVSSFGQKVAMVSRLARTYTPAAAINEVDAVLKKRAANLHISAHFFSFGGLEKTARWISQYTASPMPK